MLNSFEYFHKSLGKCKLGAPLREMFIVIKVNKNILNKLHLPSPDKTERIALVQHYSKIWWNSQQMSIWIFHVTFFSVFHETTATSSLQLLCVPLGKETSNLFLHYNTVHKWEIQRIILKSIMDLKGHCTHFKVDKLIKII